MEKKKKNREYTPMIKCKFDGNFQVLLKEDEWNILTIIGKIKIF